MTDGAGAGDADVPEADVPEAGVAEAGVAENAGGETPPAVRSRDPHAAIVAEVRARFGESAAGPAVAIYLAARGYDAAQVADVLAQLAGAPALAPDVPGGTSAVAPLAPPSGPPLRAWAPHERARFTPEAWGRLLQLRAAGLGDQEFEHLVDRALLQVDGPVTPAELRALFGDVLGPGADESATIH